MRITTEPTWHHHHHHGWAKWLQKRPRPHIDSPHSDCSEYLANPGNRRHTVQEFFAMVSKTAKVEAQYVERLKCSFPDIERMQSQGFGDISFNGDRRVDAELKLVDKRKTGSHAQFRCKMYRIHHVIDKCVREASAVFCVVLKSDGITPEQLCSDPVVFKCYVGFPTRTQEGRPNIRSDHDVSKPSHFSLLFNRVARFKLPLQSIPQKAENLSFGCCFNHCKTW